LRRELILELRQLNIAHEEGNPASDALCGDGLNVSSAATQRFDGAKSCWPGFSRRANGGSSRPSRYETGDDYLELELGRVSQASVGPALLTGK
jgi:hypothetical protein